MSKYDLYFVIGVSLNCGRGNMKTYRVKRGSVVLNMGVGQSWEYVRCQSCFADDARSLRALGGFQTSFGRA